MVFGGRVLLIKANSFDWQLLVFDLVPDQLNTPPQRQREYRHLHGIYAFSLSDLLTHMFYQCY